MKGKGQGHVRLFGAAAAAFVLPVVSFGQLHVIASGGFSAAFGKISPEFEKATGVTVVTTLGASQGSSPNTIAAQLRRGAPADVVIMAKEGLEDLIAGGMILRGTDVDVAQAPLGLAVRARAPHPDISSLERFKQVLTDARVVTFPFSTTGMYLKDKLFPRMGIASEMSVKITPTGVAAVALGEADIAIQPVSELLHLSDVDFVGTLPAEVQYISVFSAAVVAGSKQTEAAKKLVAYLISETSKPAIESSGMEPSKPR